MAIVRIIKRENPYAQIDKRPLCDPRLSYKATGVLCYLLSKPCDWEVRLEELAGAKTDGLDAVRTAMQELRQHGYAKLETVRDDGTGRVIGKRWVVFELSGGDAVDLRKHRQRQNTDIGKIPTSGKSNATKKERTVTKNDCSGSAESTELFALEQKHPDLPPPLCDNAELVTEWDAWKDARRARRKPLSGQAIKLQVGDLVKWGVVRGIAALRHSRKMDYQGLFEPKGTNGSPVAPRAPITKENVMRMPQRP